MSHYTKICDEIHEILPDVKVSEDRGMIVLEGEVSDWSLAVKAGHIAAKKKKYLGVINNITLKGFSQEMILPDINDKSLEGQTADVLIIGGGITGCAAARCLSEKKLDILIAERGADIASGASKANGAVVHVGINFPSKSQKMHYNLKGNQMYAELSRQMCVPFEQKGQVMLCFHNWEKIPVWFLSLYGKKNGIYGVKYLPREKLKVHEPYLPDGCTGGMYMPIGGITSPFEMTAALAENAVSNGVRISLNTAVTGINTENGHITSVDTNRGRIYPKVVINAAGIWADKIAEMAGDRTFTIHPRRGTDVVTDKTAGYMVQTSAAKAPFSILPSQEQFAPKGPVKKVKYIIQMMKNQGHTKGVGLIHAVAGNMLFGPNAVETPDREDTSTHANEVADLLKAQQQLAKDLKQSDIITYFTGVRAPTYEEDFVVRKGIFTDNIIEAAGIQSPGVTAAPAIAEDVALWAVEILSREMEVKDNESFNPERKRNAPLASLSEEERSELIRQNPDYGIIVCRCEEISKGEILDALKSPFCPPTLDAIKQRLRPGMGRCQGGFCSPLVMQIIADYKGIPVSEVKKGSDSAFISFGETRPKVNEE